MNIKVLSKNAKNYHEEIAKIIKKKICAIQFTKFDQDLLELWRHLRTCGKIDEYLHHKCSAVCLKKHETKI